MLDILVLWNAFRADSIETFQNQQLSLHMYQMEIVPDIGLFLAGQSRKTEIFEERHLVDFS